MDNGIYGQIKKFYFVAVAVMMYYFLTETINLGVFVSYRHAFALTLVFSAGVSFLTKPDIAKSVVALKSAAVYSVPLLVTFTVSLFIWFYSRVDTAVIARGLSSIFIYTNMLSFALAGAAFLYIFGENGIWYNLAAILCANILMIIRIIAQNGLAAYFSEFVTLISTFAEKTGDIIVKAEIHELAFCLGAYLIYMILKPRFGAPYLVLLVLMLFCFLSAFKRIAMIAIAVSLVLSFILKFIAKYHDKTVRVLTFSLTVLMILLLIGYIAVIKHGAFEMLEKIGIDTTGRAEVYAAVDKFYEFSPDFVGNGIGFLTYQLNTNMSVGVSAVHNDFLQYFIDLGFWGYILWLVSMTLLRVKYFGAKSKTENMIITFALTVYLIIVSTTDNTMNYPLLTTVLAVIMAGHGFDMQVRQTEKKMFGDRAV